MDIINKIDEKLITENKWDRLKSLDKLIQHFNDFMETYPTSPNFKKIFNSLMSERGNLAKDLGIVRE